jgi:hypothetical protein
MPTPFVAALYAARSSLASPHPVEAEEAGVARRLIREVDAAIARLEGKDAEKDLVAVVCHDLKDPLASIVMGAGYLKKTLPDNGDEGRASRRVVEAILRSAHRLSQLVGDFHDLARLGAGTLQLDLHYCDVVATLDGALGPLAKEAAERSISLSFETPAGPLLANCDRARLVQISASSSTMRSGSHRRVGASLCSSVARPKAVATRRPSGYRSPTPGAAYLLSSWKTSLTTRQTRGALRATVRASVWRLCGASLKHTVVR